MHLFQIQEHSLIADFLQDRELWVVDLGACVGGFAGELEKDFHAIHDLRTPYLCEARLTPLIG